MTQDPKAILETVVEVGQEGVSQPRSDEIVAVVVQTHHRAPAKEEVVGLLAGPGDGGVNALT